MYDFLTGLCFYHFHTSACNLHRLFEIFPLSKVPLGYFVHNFYPLLPFLNFAFYFLRFTYVLPRIASNFISHGGGALIQLFVLFAVHSSSILLPSTSLPWGFSFFDCCLHVKVVLEIVAMGHIYIHVVESRRVYMNSIVLEIIEQGCL